MNGGHFHNRDEGDDGASAFPCISDEEEEEEEVVEDPTVNGPKDRGFGLGPFICWSSSRWAGPGQAHAKHLGRVTTLKCF